VWHGLDRFGSAQATPTEGLGDCERTSSAHGQHETLRRVLLRLRTSACSVCILALVSRFGADSQARSGKPGLSAYSPAFSWRARANVARVQASKSDRLIPRDTMYWGLGGWFGKGRCLPDVALSELATPGLSGSALTE